MPEQPDLMKNLRDSLAEALARLPIAGAHTGPDGMECKYLTPLGEFCNKCGTIARKPVPIQGCCPDRRYTCEFCHSPVVPKAALDEARAEVDRLREALCFIRDGGSVADHRIAVAALERTSASTHLRETES